LYFFYEFVTVVVLFLQLVEKTCNATGSYIILQLVIINVKYISMKILNRNTISRLFLLVSILLSTYALLVPQQISAQSQSCSKCWYNLDPDKDKSMGVSSNRAYSELLEGKEATPVVVAIIDGGTDIDHEDLQGLIWVNEDEIPNNGIDDDNNGYIDDVHGWNFIGNANGDNLTNSNLEVTRVYRMLSPKYEEVDSLDELGNEEYLLYLECKRTVDNKNEESESFIETLQTIQSNLHFADSVMSLYFETEDYTDKQLSKVKDENFLPLSEFLIYWREQGVTLELIEEYIVETEKEALYRYNLEYDPRGVIGDDWTKNESPYYGNNDVEGKRAGHGTSVAGNVAAIRNNGIGPDGVTENAQLMIIRVVPGGDEYDKDVANAILYAVNNGASIINMSFGKEYSPQKHFVDSALEVANNFDVLIVHAAGNDASNNDVVDNYPLNMDDDRNIINDKFIVVGASTENKGKDLVAPFSNYGNKTVDLFAPGYDIYSCNPNDKYSRADGTSMASPVATGVATIIRAYFPELKAEEVKEILMLSVTKYDKKVWVPSDSEDKKARVKESFTNLSISGGIINAYNAVKLATERAGK
jgi:subtilisin family serine protease